MGAPWSPPARPLRRSTTRAGTIPIAQCNNVYIFPAVGLGVVASGARRVTDGMILAAARALGENSPALHDASASLLPTLAGLRQVAVQIAIAAGLEAQRAGVAPKTTEAELRPPCHRHAVDSRLPIFRGQRLAGRASGHVRTGVMVKDIVTAASRSRATPAPIARR